jgi:leader peptidase (prepilin peptidase)/N-methyltransferase
MDPTAALLGAAVVGMAAGATLIPLTRRQLAAATARAEATSDAPGDAGFAAGLPALSRWQRAVVVGASGLLPAIVWRAVGGSLAALPPLLLLVGLIQLAYCDATRRLLPKTLVHGLSATVILSGAVLAWHLGEWQRLWTASLGGVAFFMILFTMNLLNPRWMAFGDVRLSLSVGFGLSWIGVFALIEGFFIANALAAVIGISLMVLRRANRKSALPFGMYLALGAGITILAWA